MIRGIYGKPFITMDEFVDIPRLTALWDDVTLGIAKAYKHYGNYSRDCLDERFRGKDLTFFEKQAREGTLDKQELYRQLPNDVASKRMWLKLQYQAYSAFWAVVLRTSPSYRDKRFADKCRWTPDCKHFYPFISWINDQKIFESYGRIVGFVTEHDCETVTHKDDFFEGTHQDEFIWLRFKLDKAMFIQDDETYEKYYFQGHTIFFNEMDYHGGDVSPHMTVSFRIDGVFTKETREKIGVPVDNPQY